jgi:hypothetical protein
MLSSRGLFGMYATHPIPDPPPHTSRCLGPVFRSCSCGDRGLYSLSSYPVIEVQYLNENRVHHLKNILRGSLYGPLILGPLVLWSSVRCPLVYWSLGSGLLGVPYPWSPGLLVI